VVGLPIVADTKAIVKSLHVTKYPLSSRYADLSLNHLAQFERPDTKGSTKHMPTRSLVINGKDIEADFNEMLSPLSKHTDVPVLPTIYGKAKFEKLNI